MSEGTQLRSRMHFACDELVAVVSDYLEGALQDVELFEQHLVFCDGCAVYLRRYRQSLAALAALHVEEVPAPALEALRSVFHEWRRDR